MTLLRAKQKGDELLGLYILGLVLFLCWPNPGETRQSLAIVSLKVFFHFFFIWSVLRMAVSVRLFSSEKLIYSLKHFFGSWLYLNFLGTIILATYLAQNFSGLENNPGDPKPIFWYLNSILVSCWFTFAIWHIVAQTFRRAKSPLTPTEKMLLRGHILLALIYPFSSRETKELAEAVSTTIQERNVSQKARKTFWIRRYASAGWDQLTFCGEMIHWKLEFCVHSAKKIIRRFNP